MDLQAHAARITNMNSFRRGTVSRARIVAMVVVGGCLLVASQVVQADGTSRSPDGDQASSDVVRETTRFGVSAGLPKGWTVADKPLVPKLTNPRSVAAFGTFRMPVGGGGDCGMYPAKALATMSINDTLIHIQESRVSAGAKWFKMAPRRPRTFDISRTSDLSKMALLRGPNYLGRWSHRFDFRAGRRYFYVFVAFGSRPDKSAIAIAEQILNSLNFSKRSPVPWQLS